jgi:hypothetical protein
MFVMASCLEGAAGMPPAWLIALCCTTEAGAFASATTIAADVYERNFRQRVRIMEAVSLSRCSNSAR